jgi:uncharacterized protein with HEPN domain
MLQACLDIIAFTEGISFEEFLADRQRTRAAAFAFAVLGEGVKRLSGEFRTRDTAIPWQDIAGMRDRLIHGYDKIDWDLMWATASTDVPLLRDQIRQIISLSPS